VIDSRLGSAEDRDMPKPTISAPELTALAPAAHPNSKSFWLRFLADETGSDMIEYVLLASLLGLTIVISIKGVGNKIANSYNSLGTSMTNAV
jgi:Flp pilus assembly pilin Flp